MTNTQTIEKLNEGLIQLIEAYEMLQEKNNKLEDDISELQAKNADLEYKLSDFSSNNDAQASKMDGMLSKIQTLLMPSTPTEVLPKEEPTDEVSDLEIKLDDTESILDIKLDTDVDSIKDDFKQESTTKIDLGRMESLLNGLNNR